MIEKLLILSASAGAGHVRAAQAIERAFEIAGGAREVRHVDALQYTTKLFRDLYSKAYFEIVNKAPGLLGWLYDHLDKPWQNERRRLAFDKLNARRFVRLLEDYRPDMTVCTHFMPAEIISWLKAKERLTTRQAIVVTDFDVHALWLCHHYEHYFVAMEETKVHLDKIGIDASRISVTGIPIDPVFAQEKERRAVRLKHGLDPDRTTLLISGGGFGHVPLGNLVRSLLEIRHPVQVAAICGRSEELRSRLESLAGNVPPEHHVRIHVVGYTTEMDEYMAASDLVVGKPGGLTTSEALSKGLAFVVVNPIPGQEERNADHLLEEGAAIRCNNLPALAYKIDRLLEQPERLASLQANARKLGRPRAALEIASKLAELGSGLPATGDRSPQGADT